MVYIVYYSVYSYYCGVFSEKYVYTKFSSLSELYGHICSYRNVWPETVYCCFTRTTLFTEFFTCFSDQSSVRLHLLVSNVLPEAVYCCFTRTTLFNTMFIVVYSLKSMCIPSFVLIGFCVSELPGHLCPYHNVLPEAVYCCFTRTKFFTEM